MEKSSSPRGPPKKEKKSVTELDLGGTPSQRPNPMEGKQGVDVSESKPEFEARSKKDLAWHDVANFTRYRKSRTGELEGCVRYAGYGGVDDEWVNVKKGIRDRSIQLEPSKCHKVKDGDLVLCFLEKDDYALYFNARVVRIQRRLHDEKNCKCIFTVRFLHDNSEDEIDWKRLWYRPTQGESTEEESVVCHTSSEPAQEESTKEEYVVCLRDIKNLWP